MVDFDGFGWEFGQCLQIQTAGGFFFWENAGGHEIQLREEVRAFMEF